MSQKTEKPVLQGQRIKTRKRGKKNFLITKNMHEKFVRIRNFTYHRWAVVFSDEKEKYDPSAFRNAIIQGLNEAGNDLDQVRINLEHLFFVFLITIL